MVVVQIPPRIARIKLRETKAYARLLRKYGFKKSGTTSFDHEKNSWHADILDMHNYVEVWLVGRGLKDGGFPGGWVYGDAKSIADELDKALQNLKSKP